MEGRTTIKMVAIGATVVEQKDGIECAVGPLLNPKILGEVPEGMNMIDMAPLEGRWKLED